MADEFGGIPVSGKQPRHDEFGGVAVEEQHAPEKPSAFERFATPTVEAATHPFSAFSSLFPHQEGVERIEPPPGTKTSLRPSLGNFVENAKRGLAEIPLVKAIREHDIPSALGNVAVMAPSLAQGILAPETMAVAPRGPLPETPSLATRIRSGIRESANGESTPLTHAAGEAAGATVGAAAGHPYIGARIGRTFAGRIGGFAEGFKNPTSATFERLNAPEPTFETSKYPGVSSRSFAEKMAQEPVKPGKGTGTDYGGQVKPDFSPPGTLGPRRGINRALMAEKPATETKAAPAGTDTTLDDLSKSLAGKPFAKLDPARQEQVRDVAAKIQAPSSLHGQKIQSSQDIARQMNEAMGLPPKPTTIESPAKPGLTPEAHAGAARSTRADTAGAVADAIKAGHGGGIQGIKAPEDIPGTVRALGHNWPKTPQAQIKLLNDIMSRLKE